MRRGQRSTDRLRRSSVSHAVHVVGRFRDTIDKDVSGVSAQQHSAKADRRLTDGARVSEAPTCCRQQVIPSIIFLMEIGGR